MGVIYDIFFYFIHHYQHSSSSSSYSTSPFFFVFFVFFLLVLFVFVFLIVIFFLAIFAFFSLVLLAFFPCPYHLLLNHPYHLLLVTRPLGHFLPCHEARPYRSCFIDFINNLLIYLLLFYLFSLRSWWMHRFAYRLLRKRVMHQYYWLMHTAELEILGTLVMEKRSHFCNCKNRCHYENEFKKVKKE